MIDMIRTQIFLDAGLRPVFNSNLNKWFLCKNDEDFIQIIELKNSNSVYKIEDISNIFYEDFHGWLWFTPKFCQNFGVPGEPKSGSLIADFVGI
jgi:hypothetical protein